MLRQRCTPIESRGLPKTAQSRWRHPPPPPRHTPPRRPFSNTAATTQTCHGSPVETNERTRHHLVQVLGQRVATTRHAPRVCEVLARPQRPPRMDRLVSRLWGPVSTLGVVADGPSPAPRDPTAGVHGARPSDGGGALHLLHHIGPRHHLLAPPSSAPLSPARHTLASTLSGWRAASGAGPPPATHGSALRSTEPLAAARTAASTTRHPASPSPRPPPSSPPPLVPSARTRVWSSGTRGSPRHRLGWGAQVPPAGRGGGATAVPRCPGRGGIGRWPAAGPDSCGRSRRARAGLGATARGCARGRLCALFLRASPPLATEPWCLGVCPVSTNVPWRLPRRAG